MDNYLRRSLKKSVALQPPPPGGKLRLLKAAAAPDSPGILKSLVHILFPGNQPLEKTPAVQIASQELFDKSMVWVFRSGMVNLRFFF
jgi:hypothetical protein